MFMEHPELIAGRLFIGKMMSLECVVMTGAERYSRSTGYASTTKFNGDAGGTIQNEIVAIDALDFSRNVNSQFTKDSIFRELNKAYCGFSNAFSQGKDLATGHWGCGAFNGNKDLKCLIQLIAASAAGYKHVAYSNKSDPNFSKRFKNAMAVFVATKMTVNVLLDVLLKSCESNLPKRVPGNEIPVLDIVANYINTQSKVSSFFSKLF